MQPQEQPPAEEEEPAQQDAPEDKEEGGEADDEAEEQEEAKPEIVVRVEALLTCQATRVCSWLMIGACGAQVQTSPYDPRFPSTNQARNCYTRYNEFYRWLPFLAVPALRESMERVP